MKGNNVLGLIFANMRDSSISEITAKRTMASVPFGGKYRLVDFPLSNMVNSGMNDIGIVAEKNFFSLMDHVSSGKAWDLSRKRGGLKILPPYVQGDRVNGTLIESIYSIKSFINSCSEEYILLSSCDIVANINFSEMFDQHSKTGADFTFLTINSSPCGVPANPMVVKVDPDNRINELLVNPEIKEPCHIACGAVLTNRKLLLELVSDCISKNKLNHQRYLFQDNLTTYKFYAYEHTGFSSVITSTNSYFNANMNLMNPEVRADFFRTDRPIFTKVRDDMPSRYGLGSSVKNSLVSQGCIIEGHVENCIISKGVHIGKNTKVSNCVIMQDTKIGKNTNLNYVICDKDVIIKDDRLLAGFDSYPIYVRKQSII